MSIFIAFTDFSTSATSGFTPETCADPFYGEDEEPFEQQCARERLEIKIQTKKLRQNDRKLNPHVVHFDAQDIAGFNVIEKCVKRQTIPSASIITAGRSIGEDTEETKRRKFANLQRQLRQELEKAESLGTIHLLTEQDLACTSGWAIKDLAAWERTNPRFKKEELESMINDADAEMRKVVNYLITARIGRQMRAKPTATPGENSPEETDEEDQVTFSRDEEIFKLDEEASGVIGEVELARQFRLSLI